MVAPSGSFGCACALGVVVGGCYLEGAGKTAPPPLLLFLSTVWLSSSLSLAALMLKAFSCNQLVLMVAKEGI